MNNSMPLISVIMSCYNEKIEWIKKSVDSIINQTYKNIQFIIICDNPNNEEVKQVLLRYKEIDDRIELVFNKKNLGLIKSLNTGLEICKGEYIARMDADDISHSNRLEEELKYFNNNPEIDFVMSGINYINEDGKKIKSTPILMHRNIQKLLTYGNISIHPTWMFKSNILDRIKGYDEILYVEDYDFLCRSIIAGYKAGYIPQILLDYRVRKSGITKSRRAEQEVFYQIVSGEYRKAFNKKKEYKALDSCRSISEEEIEKFMKVHDEFQEGKMLLKEKKYIKAILILSRIIITSRIKRRQIYNYTRLKVLSRIY